jgi:hypothetical protein
MHLPFANDTELKEHSDRCHAFDQGTFLVFNNILTERSFAKIMMYQKSI